jgi:hypothetical protein
MADATAARAPAANASRRPATTPAGFNPTGALVVAVLLAFAGASPRPSVRRARASLFPLRLCEAPAAGAIGSSLPPSLSLAAARTSVRPDARPSPRASRSSPGADVFTTYKDHAAASASPELAPNEFAVADPTSLGGKVHIRCVLYTGPHTTALAW